MMDPRKAQIKETLKDKLIGEHAFWWADENSVQKADISDDQLISLTMRHLDLEEINELFKIFPFSKIKAAWKRLLVPEGEYLYTLNRFFAWYYFGAKRPDSYIKSIATRHYNSLIMQK